MTLLESEIVAINQLPNEILQAHPLTDARAFALSQLTEGTGFQPLPENYIPQSVEFFVNDLEEPSFHSFGDEIISIGIEFFTITQPQSAVLQIDNIPRYVELDGVERLCTLGGCRLPEPLVYWSDRIQLLKQLMQ